MTIPAAFGAIERTPDPRDFPLGAVSPGSTRPSVFMQDWSKLAVEYQRLIPACGSHAGAFLKNIQETIQTGTPQRKSPMYLWKRIKLIDGFAPDQGTDMLSIFKTLKNYGVCDFSLTGNDTTMSVEAYTDPSTITPAMDADAKKALIKENGYAFTFSPSMGQVKQAIYDFKSVLVLIRIGEEFWKPSWAENDVLPLRAPQSVIGGHFVVAHSYDEQYVYFRNEWSDAWGKKGDGYFGDNYIPFVAEIGTAFDVPPGFSKDLSMGMANLDVWSLQRFLVKNGYATFTPTGFFGSMTFAAVQMFQRRYGIPATGYVGPLTRTKLNLLLG